MHMKQEETIYIYMKFKATKVQNVHKLSEN